MGKLFLTEVPEHGDNLEQTILKLTAEIDPLSMKSYILIRKLGTDLETHLDLFFSQHKLSAGRFLLLLLLKAAPEGLSPRTLAQKVGVTQATISGLISSLEKAGLILRKTHNQDGRSFIIQLSEKGHHTVETLSPDFFSKVKSFLAPLQDQEKNFFNGHLEGLISRVHLLNNK